MKLTAAKFAEFRGRTKGWVSKQIADGMPAQGLGKSGSEYTIDSEAAIDWEVAGARRAVEQAKASERERLARAQTERVQLENAKRRGELMLTADAIAVVTALATDLAGRLDAVAGRLANEIPSITDPAIARTRLLEEHRAVRAGLAEHLRKISEEDVAASADGGADRTPAAAHGERVGGREPRVAAGKRRTGTASKR